MPQSSPSTVLIIEDNLDALSNLQDILEIDGYRVWTAGSAADALRFEGWAELFAIILDRRLPDGTAEQLLPRLQELAPQAAVIIVTGFGDLEGAIAALRQGAADYILKPIDAATLRNRLARLAKLRKTQLALDRSEAQLGSLLLAVPCTILILQTDGTIQYLSPYAEQLTGFRSDELLGRNLRELFAEDSRLPDAGADRVRRLLAAEPLQGFESVLLNKAGRQVSMVWNTELLRDYGGKTAILAVGQDITSLKQAQEVALQAERLAAIGQMVTGLAHESRNALQRSQACLEMLALEVQHRPEALNLVERIQKAQDHLHHLYEEVRSYAAPLRFQQQLCDLRQILRETWEHLELQRKGRDVRFDLPSDGETWECHADQYSLEQLFRNILENSLSACADPVEIEIRAQACQHAGCPAWQLSLRDNGPGLSAEQRERIFQPFFTTKTRGTGLGMAIAKRIVEGHGGRIAVGPADDWPGTEILITLPRQKPEKGSP
jgi:hypothetical protein